MYKLFLEGTVCTGKNVMLQTLVDKYDFIDYVNTDCYNVQQMYPFFCFKNTRLHVNFLQDLFIKNKMFNFEKPVQLFNKTLLYNYTHFMLKDLYTIYDDINKGIEKMENDSDKIYFFNYNKKKFSILKNIDLKQDIIIIIDSNIENVLNRMRIRNNPCDILNSNYIKYQNYFYSRIGEIFNLTILDINELKFNGCLNYLDNYINTIKDKLSNN